MDGAHLCRQGTGEMFRLGESVTTVGRGAGVDVRLDDPTVSPLHAEIVRRGPHVYVQDLGLSVNGTRVNGRRVARRVLAEGDVLSFGLVRTRVGGLGGDPALRGLPEVRRMRAPELTRRELEVLWALCRPALQQDAFVNPCTADEIASELVVGEGAVKQHLLRLYAKFEVSAGVNRRLRLADEAVRAGLVHPRPGADLDG